MISVIIPAHNEDKVIAASLKELVPGTDTDELEIIVVCNGCSDNTVRVVAAFGPAVRCIETDQSGKANALNLGDAAAPGFPRIYQDADVVINIGTVRKIANILREEVFLAAAPEMRMDFVNASWPVRAYYEVWQRLPYVKEGLIGTGVYALSEKGRRRFDTFPSVIADDGYIRALFKAQERTVLKSCYSLVRAPANLNGLIKIKTRSRLGGYELKEKFPELMQNEEKNYGSAVFELSKQFNLWFKYFIYLYVNIIARLRAIKHARAYGFSGWERDESSREQMDK